MFSALVVTVMASWSCAEEDLRVTQHLEDALVQLKTETPVGLSADQRVAREAVLDDLRRYIDAKEFPRSNGPTSPVFVDDADQHCAMGALISWNGGDDIVRNIRRTRNLATVPTLVDEPGLADWLTTHGMTVEEAALVQPTYYQCIPSLDACTSRSIAQEWLANGGEPSPLGVPSPVRIATPDGQCAGAGTGGFVIDAPAGLVFQSASGVVRSGNSFSTASWVRCREPMIFSAAVMNAPTVEACMRAMVEEDVRAVLPVCGDHFSQRFVALCGEDGRYLSQSLPSYDVRVLLNQYFTSTGIDAGLPPIDFNALMRDAWARSDDGGTAVGELREFTTWNGTNASTCVLHEDGGVENVIVDQPEAPTGCSSAPVALMLLATLLIRVRRSTV